MSLRAEVAIEVDKRLAKIAELFKPCVKLTLIVRNPEISGNRDDEIFTDDDLTEAMIAIAARLEEQS